MRHIARGLLVLFGVLAGAPSLLLFSNDTAADTRTEVAKCVAITGDATRLDCFDRLARDMGVDQSEVKKEGPPNRWRVREETSAMNGSTNVYVSIRAQKDIQGWQGTYRPVLYFRCTEGETEAYITIGMAAHTDRLGYGATSYTNSTLRIDKLFPFSEGMSQSAEREALFFKNAEKLARKLFDHDELLFRFTPLDSSPTLTTFKIVGLRDTIKPLRDACGWPEQQLDSDLVVRVQIKLKSLDYYKGTVDGIYGPKTKAALEAFQQVRGLPVTGIPDKVTADAVVSYTWERRSAAKIQTAETYTGTDREGSTSQATQERGIDQPTRSADERLLAAMRENASIQFVRGREHLSRGDPKAAWMWMCLAANQGHADAQNWMGDSYRVGRWPAKRDLVKAHLWYSLGADTGSATIGDARYGVAKRLTRDEIEEARYFLKRWKPSPWSCQVSHMGEVAG